MSTKSKTAEIHVKAATHHEAAALHHKEAAKAHEMAKPDVAAQHALIAQGHLAHASDLGAAVAKEHAAAHAGAAKAA